MDKHLSDYDKKRNQMQFDSFCKRILRGEVIDCRKEIAKLSEHEICFSELPKQTTNALFVIDEYPSDSIVFQVENFDVAVHNALLAEALKELPVRKRDIVLLAYFLDMNDVEIARLLHKDPSTIQYHRTSALSKLKKVLLEDL